MKMWKNQEEAVQFALSRPAVMLDMDMGTGKTRVAIETMMAREDVSKILVVCPKAVIPVWRTNLEKFVSKWNYTVWDETKGTVKKKTESLKKWLDTCSDIHKNFVVVNYEVVWRDQMGEYIYRRAGFDAVILDESHRAKSAGSKVSKYLGMLGKTVKYKMCLSGTPMANSPLDIYGQYRFLDPHIFGTRYNVFEQQYAIMGGPELKFVVGFKNQKDLQAKFASIAYTCKMSDVADRLKLPAELPPVERKVLLPGKDMKILHDLGREFIAECESGSVVASNVLVKMLRMQQITSGFCEVVGAPGEVGEKMDINTSKADELRDILSDISPLNSVVVFCVFKHDIGVVRHVADEVGREAFELTGEFNQLENWKSHGGGVLAVQIQAGAEGVDMTNAHHAIYFNLPHSLALYNQSKARLYRPGQTDSVAFIHLIAENTIDQAIYESLRNKRDVIEAIKTGELDLGYIR